ncbi:MAG TPA: response regulator [Polyangia bacterium]|jgi:DNA-binding response OmpR family regulator|nr:response regulator [Polyangia bacterium]
MARILIVNDELDLLELCQLTLCEAGYDAEITTGGRKAVERARRGDLDLIVVDWVMPDMDGNAVLARLKGGPETRDIPVLAMSALRDGKTRAHLAGADSFLAKPFGPDDLVNAVAQTLSSSRYNGKKTDPQTHPH